MNTIPNISSDEAQADSTDSRQAISPQTPAGLTVAEEALYQQMIEAGVHYGRKKTLSHPSMKRYLAPMSAHLEIFDLAKTKEGLERAAETLQNMTREGKIILFVGVKPAACHAVKELAEAFRQPYVVERWVGGLMTNFGVVQARIAFMKDLRAKRDRGEFAKYPVKERQNAERTLEKLEKLYGGIEGMLRIPDALFIVDVRARQHVTAYREAARRGIPVVVVAGSDNPIREAMIIIPGNDKAPRSIRFLTEFLKARASEATTVVTA